jgi:hypothetical protein
VSARNEFYEAAIAQVLKLLPNLRSDVLVAGIEVAKVSVKSVNLVKREVTLP